MSFSSYKYTFRLNASHSNVGNESSVHSHTFEIALYMKPDNDSFVEYDETEKHVDDYLSRFSGHNLNLIPPFDNDSSTIENMGKVFFSDLSEILANNGYRLLMLEIGENPLRLFRVTEKNITQKKIERANSFINQYPKTNSPEKSDGSLHSTPLEQSEFEDVKANAKQILPEHKNAHLISTPKYSQETFIFQVFILVIAGALAMIYVRFSDMYPLGMDIHGHLFKADLMFQGMREGNLYPLYTELWYNGIQPFRYWPPLPYYCLAFFQFLSNGNVMNAYLLFIWLSFSVGGIGWLLFARNLKRPWLGFFFALTWFLLPDNMRVFFGEGNLPRMFIAMFIPYLFYCLWQFVHYKRKKMIIPLLVLMLVVIMGHLMISAMVGVAAAFFLLFYSISNKRWLESIHALLVMLLAFAVSGIWVYPSLRGGITAMSSEATSSMVALVSEKLTISLNPFLRMDGGIATLYIGLSVVLIALIGIFLSNRKSAPGFITLILFVIGTAASLASLIIRLPLSQYFWVRRFIPIVYALFIISMLEWKTLKKSVLVFMCCLMLVDFLPSADLEGFDKRMNIPATHSAIDQSMDKYLFSKAKQLTIQRVSLMDLSQLGPMPSYAFGTLLPKTPYVFGWAWQASVTAMNIAYLNESIEMGNYLYLFDRNLELGADVVIIDKKQVLDTDARVEMFKAASKIGYNLKNTSDYSWLFSYPVDSTFGVITDYDCLAIGTTAALVPGILPYYHPGDKLFVDDYTVEELIKYKKIYLSGFFYNNRKDAEELVRKIADAGVQVFIDMSRIPADPLTNRMTFLDIDAQPITFSYSFPNLVTENKVIRPKPFTEEYDTWNTVYLNGLTTSTGYAWFENSPRLDFIGTGSNDNITFIGFNILFHAYTADDSYVKEILNNVMDLQEENLPERTIVPLSVEHGKNTITIRSDYDNVNTTLAYQDIFSSDQPIRSMNNLLIVDRGTTIIRMSYPHFGAGLLVSLLGILAESAMIYLIFRKSKNKRS